MLLQLNLPPNLTPALHEVLLVHERLLGCCDFSVVHGSLRWPESQRNVHGAIILDAEPAPVDQGPDGFWALVGLKAEVNCQESSCSHGHILFFCFDFLCWPPGGPQLRQLGFLLIEEAYPTLSLVEQLDQCRHFQGSVSAGLGQVVVLATLLEFVFAALPGFLQPFLSCKAIISPSFTTLK